MRWTLGLLAAVLTVVLAAACERQKTVVAPCILPLALEVTPASATRLLNDTASFLARKVPNPCFTSKLTFVWRTGDSTSAVVLSSTDSTVIVRGIRAGAVAVIASVKEEPTAQAAGVLIVAAPIPPAAPRRTRQ